MFSYVNNLCALLRLGDPTSRGMTFRRDGRDSNLCLRSQWCPFKVSRILHCGFSADGYRTGSTTTLFIFIDIAGVVVGTAFRAIVAVLDWRWQAAFFAFVSSTFMLDSIIEVEAFGSFSHDLLHPTYHLRCPLSATAPLFFKRPAASLFVLVFEINSETDSCLDAELFNLFSRPRYTKSQHDPPNRPGPNMLPVTENTNLSFT